MLPDAVITQITAPFIDRELSAADLEELRDRLTRAYVSRGYINSGAVLPDQRFENGELTYRVVEGRLTEINVTGTVWLSPRYVRERLARSIDFPLNMNDVERGVQLLLNDPAIAQMNVELVPGLEPGEARLQVNVTERKMYSLAATVANSEPPNVGSVLGELDGVVRDLTGWGDVLGLRYGRTAGVNEGGVAWTFPVTAADTAVTVRWDYNGAAAVAQAFRGLDITSTTVTYGIAVSQPLYRTPEQALTISLGFDSEASDTFLLGEPFSFSPGFANGHARANTVRLSLDWIDRGVNQVVALRSTFSRGVDLLGATNLPRQPNANFTIWLGQAQYVHSVFGSAEIVARGDVQLSTSPLFPFQQIAIGGPTTVRGYPVNTLLLDNGIIFSLEGRIPVLRLSLPYIAAGEKTGLLQVAPFLDFGTGWNTRSPTPAPRTLGSIGIGLLWEVSENLAAQLYYGHGFQPIHETGHDLQNDGIYFRIVASLL